MDPLPPPLAGVFARQYGLATSSQLRAWLSPRQSAHLAAAGLLVREGRRVWRFTVVARSWRQRCMLACLEYGAPVAVDGLAAARLWGWDGVGKPPVRVAVPSGRSGRRGAIPARRVVLPPTDITARLSIPLTTPARTLLDVAGDLAERPLGALFDHLMNAHQLRAEEILHRLPARAARAAGAPGGDSLATLHRLAALRAGRPTGESPWEGLLLGWLLSAGLPIPALQYQAVLGGRVFLLDLAYPEYLVAVEFDGWQAHRGRERFDRDRARTTELALAGWLVVLVTSAHGEAATVERVARALRSRGWQPEAAAYP